jgi:hypothetical protein
MEHDMDKNKYEVKHSGEVEIEHSVSLLTLGILCLVIWAPCWWYDNEIRCALGNVKSCVAIKEVPAKAQ